MQNLSDHSPIADVQDEEMGSSDQNLKWLEYPFELLTFRSTVQANDLEVVLDEKISRFKILNIWVQAYQLLEVAECIEDSPPGSGLFREIKTSAFFFQPGQPNGGWRFQDLQKNDADALKNPVSNHECLDFSNNPREDWDVIKIRRKR